MPDQATYLTTRQLQELLQVDRLTIYRLLDAGDIPAFKIGRQWRFDSREIERWLNKRSDTQSASSEQAEPTTRSQGIENLPLAGMQTIQDSFARVLGLRLAIVTKRAQPVTSPSNEQPLDQLLQTTSARLDYLAVLIEAGQKNLELEEDGAIVGMLSQTLQLGQQGVAWLCCGPFVYAERTEALHANLDRMAQACDLPRELLYQALLKTRALNQAEREQFAALLTSLAVAIETLIAQEQAFRQHLQKIAALATQRVGEL